MRLTTEMKKKYYNVCYKQKLNFLFNNDQMKEQFYAQKRLLESMFPKYAKELDSIYRKAIEKAEKDFNFFTTLS